MKLGPSDFTDYREGWVPYAINVLGMTPAGQHGAWRVWWREFIGMPDPLAGVKCAGRSYTDASGSIPDEVGS
jgi:hypothetical protein